MGLHLQKRKLGFREGWWLVWDHTARGGSGTHSSGLPLSLSLSPMLLKVTPGVMSKPTTAIGIFVQGGCL